MPASPPRISIALCTYNAGCYLPQQLASFAAQDRSPDELVVCDDGSQDETWEQLEAFATRAPFSVRLMRNTENLGYSRNFAQTIRQCTGEVIALSDQDDAWSASKLSVLEAMFLKDGNALAVFSNGHLMNEVSEPVPGDLWGSFHFTEQDQHRMTQGEAVQVLLQRNVVTGMALAIRRELADALESMPMHWPHDSWLALIAASRGGLRFSREKLVTYRVHAQQQIGVPITRQEKITFLKTRGLGAYLDLSRERNLRDYQREAVQYESLLDRAVAHAEIGSAWWLPLARSKAEHARRGIVNLRTSRGKRVRAILQHWRSYGRYSPTGSAAFWRDLIL